MNSKNIIIVVLVVIALLSLLLINFSRSQTPTQSTLPNTIIYQRMVIEPNDILVPHLYDWYFDGGGYIVYDNLPYGGINVSKTGTVVIRFNDVEYTTWQKFVSHSNYFNGTFYDSFLTVGEGSDNDYYIQVVTGTTMDFQDIGYFDNIGMPFNYGSWGELAFSVDVSLGKAWYFANDGRVWHREIVPGFHYGWLLGGINRIYVATGWGGSWKGYISYVAASWSVNWTAPFIRTLNVRDVLYLLDPTFFNGSTYIDLVTSTMGVPHGNVYRIDAQDKWIWQVKGFYSDGLVHLRFFKGFYIWFINSDSNTLVKYVYVSSDDVAIDLPAGTYDVYVTTEPCLIITIPTALQTITITTVQPVIQISSVIIEKSYTVTITKTSSIIMPTTTTFTQIVYQPITITSPMIITKTALTASSNLLGGWSSNPLGELIEYIVLFVILFVVYIYVRWRR